MVNLAEYAFQRDQRNLSPVPREDNKLRIEDRAAHDWYRFILSFPAHLVRTYVHRFGLQPKHNVLDPFCGTGTTLVECKKLGIPSCGIEPNPMASFASRVKVDWDIDPKALVTHATHVASLTMKRLAGQGIEDEDGLPLFPSAKRPLPELKTIAPDAFDLLLTGCIGPLPLHKTLVLLETLE